MRIIFWGARGAFPVCGPEFARYGGDTTCVEVRDPVSGYRIIIDAGSGIRKLGRLLVREKASSADLLFTHTHWDHILGLPLFQPLYQAGFTVNLYGRPGLQGNLHKLVLQNLLRAPHFPVGLNELGARVIYQEVGAGFQLNSFHLKTMPISHPNLGQGFRIRLGDRGLVFLTDNELGYRHRGGGSFEEYVRFARGADLLIHDSQYTRQEYPGKRTWGHSTYQDALELAHESGVKRLGFFHHDPCRSDSQIDSLVQNACLKVRKRSQALECFAVHQGLEMEI